MSYTFTKNKKKPYVVAAARLPQFNQNAIALTYARWLADQLNWQNGPPIYQTNTVKRDQNSDLLERMYMVPTFEANINPDHDYFIVDDVCTGGGSIAELISFIKMRQANVVGASVLGAWNGQDSPLYPSPKDLLVFKDKYGSIFSQFLREEFDYDERCITKREYDRLIRYSTPDAARVAILDAKNRGNE
jgi:hypothetical protein